MNNENEATARAQKKAESRRKILDSARAIFFRDGFMAANLDEVAERAGVAKGTLYRYFESKADLYVAVLAENGKAFTDKLSQSAEAEGSVTDRLTQLSGFYFEYWTRNSDYFQIFWAIDNQAVIGDLPGPVIEEVTRLWEESLRVLNSLLEEGVRTGELVVEDVWAAANILWTIANAIIQSESTMARRDLRSRPLKDVFDSAIATFLRGLQAG